MRSTSYDFSWLDQNGHLMEDLRGFHFPFSGLGESTRKIQLVANQLQIAFSFFRVQML